MKIAHENEYDLNKNVRVDEYQSRYYYHVNMSSKITLNR